MQMGMIGLGRMGANMLRRLARDGHDCIGHARGAESVGKLVAEGFRATTHLDEFISMLDTPRVIWCMVPHGDATESIVQALAERLEQGDVIIDGGNSYFKDDARRAKQLADKGIHYMDVGTSGGVWGLDRGYCLMTVSYTHLRAHETF